MKLHFLGIVTLCLLAFFGDTNAQESENSDSKMFEIANEFGNCAGLFDAFSAWIGNEDPAASEHYRYVANGAEIAASMVATMVNNDSRKSLEFAKNLRIATGPRWKSILFGNGITEDVAKQVTVCEQLNSLQVELVDEARKRAYGFSE